MKALLQSVSLLVQRVTTVGVPVAVGVFVSRQLGDVAFGQFTLVLATVSGFQIVTEFGLDKFLPREFVERGTTASGFRTWVGFKLTLSLLLYVLAVLGSAIAKSDGGITLSLALYGTSLFVTAYTTTYRSHYVARGQTRIVAVAALAGGGAGLLLSIVVLLFSWGSVPVIGFLLSACSVLELLALAKAADDWTWLLPRRPHPLTQLQRTWEFALQAILSAVYTRTGIYALGLLGGTLAVATYAKAGTIYSAMSLVPAAAALVIYPDLIAFAQRGDRSHFAELIWRNLLQVLGVLLPFVVLLFLYGQEIMELIYQGDIDSRSLSVLRILLAAFVLLAGNSVLAVSLFALHAQNAVAKLSLFSLGWSITIHWFLVSRGLAVGAAWATLLSEIGTSALFVPLLFSRVRQLKPHCGGGARNPLASSEPLHCTLD